MGNGGFWEYFERQMRRRKLTQAKVAKEMKMSSSTVSRWRVQAPTPETLRTLAPVLRRPVLELFVAAGHLTAEEADGVELRHLVANDPEVEPVDVVAAIEADPHLLPEAKVHILNQYQLLLRIGEGPGSGETLFTVPDRQGPSAAKRRRRPTT